MIIIKRKQHTLVLHDLFKGEVWNNIKFKQLWILADAVFLMQIHFSGKWNPQHYVFHCKCSEEEECPIRLLGFQTQ